MMGTRRRTGQGRRSRRPGVRRRGPDAAGAGGLSRPSGPRRGVPCGAEVASRGRRDLRSLVRLRRGRPGRGTGRSRGRLAARRAGRLGGGHLRQRAGLNRRLFKQS